ncbi:MAG TPA: hypothetical protein VHF65_05435 [Nitrososphaera sp.]|nr:hypothetical protein [Nitrososphaera sp.]
MKTRWNGGSENDVMEGNDDNDFLYGFGGVPNNDNLDGGGGPDICQSEPDPEINCERRRTTEAIIYLMKSLGQLSL